MKDPKKFIKRHKFIEEHKLQKSENQSYNFDNTKATVSVVAQQAAETTGNPQLINYLKNAVDSDLKKLPLGTGELTISKKDQGLYSGFFSDKDGQVVEQFDNATLPIIAKTLEVKELYIAPVPVESPGQLDEEMTETAAAVAQEFIEHHNRTMHAEKEEKSNGYMRLKYGDFEIEIKKSMQEFISAHRKNHKAKLKADVKKSISAWRRNSPIAKSFKSDLEAVRALLGDWNTHGEDFNQIVEAMRRKKNG